MFIFMLDFISVYNTHLYLIYNMQKKEKIYNKVKLNRNSSQTINNKKIN